MPYPTHALLAGALLLLAAVGEARSDDVAPPPTRAELSVPEAHIRWDPSAPQPVVEVRVNGRGPFRVILDTGSPHGLILDQVVADSLGLAAQGTTSLGDPNHPRAIVAHTGHAREVTMGDIRVPDAPVTWWPHAVPVVGAGAPVGVLSYAMFAPLLLTLDYPHHALVARSGELPPADGVQVLDYTTDQGLPLVGLEIQGVRLRAHLDSGSAGGLSLPLRYADSLKLAGPLAEVARGRTVNGELVIRGAPLAGSFRFGGREYHTPLVTFTDLPQGNMGGRMLADFAVTLDQRNHRVRFEPDTANHTPAGGLTPPRRYGIRFDPAATAMTVLAVDPGSPAERGGVKPGDVVTAIDGEPTAGMDLARRMGALRRPELALTLQRDGRRLTVHLTLGP